VQKTSKERKMPIQDMDKLKATSPSPSVQRGVDQAWGQQNENSTDPKKVLADKHTKNPIDPSKG
jgi:hypothetical protein